MTTTIFSLKIVLFKHKNTTELINMQQLYTENLFFFLINVEVNNYFKQQSYAS